jgi:hypothetical protein
METLQKSQGQRQWQEGERGGESSISTGTSCEELAMHWIWTPGRKKNQEWIEWSSEFTEEK